MMKPYLSFGIWNRSCNGRKWIKSLRYLIFENAIHQHNTSYAEQTYCIALLTPQVGLNMSFKGIHHYWIAMWGQIIEPAFISLCCLDAQVSHETVFLAKHTTLCVECAFLFNIITPMQNQIIDSYEVMIKGLEVEAGSSIKYNIPSLNTVFHHSEPFSQK